jgi:eukaryotic-like serine/threonine-protein kinase
MSVSIGSRIGPYEILKSIGAGGMGEVFRARDARLDRDVALKVLPSSFAGDTDRLQRFEQEARAAAALNHPNILVVHDVGSDGGVPYVVSELLDGQTLRQVLDGGSLPPRKAGDYATQIASGLAAAHDRGIVHRDVKPENVFITKDGRAKILDFGLAKLVAPSVPGASQATALQTDPGTVLGTAGYMSPEQLRGEDVDARSDIFSLGAILYEMYAGRRAFSGRSAVETMSAILREDPPELGPARGVSPAVERVIRRCLEKNPMERFQSARDVTFALDALSTVSSASHDAIPAAVPRPRSGLGVAIAVSAAAAVIAAGATMAVMKRMAPPASSQPTVHQLTFRSGTVRGARFAPDGKSVVYGAAWEGRPIELYAVREQSPESSTINLPAADLLSISSTGEMAVALRAAAVGPFTVAGTLARAPMAGGGARELTENVVAAEWSPDGKQLAVVRAFNAPQRMQLEYPVGTVLFEAPLWISDVRLSPDGSQAAFITHPNGDEGDVEIIDLASKARRTLSRGWISIQGLAWAAGGGEIWFTATKSGGMRALWAVTPTGQERLVFRAPQRMTLHDITSTGRVLMVGQTMRSETQFGSIKEKVERKLSWFDWATNVSVSADGKLIAFTESGEGAGEKYGVYVRGTDGSPAIRVGDGSARTISPDGKWVAAQFTDGRTAIQILPIGAGEARAIEVAPLERVNAVRWFPDSRRLVIVGSEKDHKPRTYELAVTGGTPKPMTPEGVTGNMVSPDGKWLPVRGADNVVALFPLDGGPPKPLPAVGPNTTVAGWLGDSRSFLIRSADSRVQISRVDVQTGASTPVETLGASDPAGVVSMGAVAFAADGDHYVFNYFRVLSELFLIDGLK